MRYISHAKARQLAYAWHGGQCSPLYAFASSGIVQNLDALKSEVISCFVMPFSDCKEKARNTKELQQLQRYIENKLGHDNTSPDALFAQWFYDRNIGF